MQTGRGLPRAGYAEHRKPLVDEYLMGHYYQVCRNIWSSASKVQSLRRARWGGSLALDFSD